MKRLIAFFVLGTALAVAQDRPLDNIASRQYQHEIRPVRLALDRWLHELGFQDPGLSIHLVKASDLAPNSCGMSTYVCCGYDHKAIAKVLIARNYMQRNEGRHLGNKKVIPKEGRLRLIKILPAIPDEAEELDEDSNSAGKEKNAGACGTPI